MRTPNSQRYAAATLALAVTLCAPLYASKQWQPMASERLIKLPAPVMVKAIELDFRNSPLASDLAANQHEVSGLQRTLGSLRESIDVAEAVQKVGLQHEYLQQKSGYLDAMEQRQALKKTAAQTRIDVYNGILNALTRDRRRASDHVSKQVRDTQLAARERMERMASHVDDLLYPELGEATSQYNREYAHNIDKIKALQQAIRTHGANQSVGADGTDVSRETFVRGLLAEAESELALINQEKEMLGYMARLVALDAQALQIQVAYGDDVIPATTVDSARPAEMVDFFVN